ncbi:MAG: hypothetical protein HOP30_21080 [Cyclobacteriaceae bacterium]|nr:hypothetical protein [Cyclobacteriaceae bacterium]
MRILALIIISVLWLLSCERTNKQVDEFQFDNNRIVDKTIHSYEFYPDGKIKMDHSMSYYFMNGELFDSLNWQKFYTYSKAGKLESTIDLTDSSRRLYIYNEVDSLVGDFAINSHGDTSFFSTAEYVNNKLVKRVNRLLRQNFQEGVDHAKMIDERKYDTLLDITEFKYNGDKLEKTISKDEKGNIISEILEVYKDKRKIKSMTYSYLGKTKFVSEITEFADGSGNIPDYTTVGPNGDTISYRKTIFRNKSKVVLYYNRHLNSMNVSYYNERGLLIGTVDTDLSQKTRRIYSYQYDDKGNIVEEASYREDLND